MLIDWLDVRRVIVPELVEGHGTVRCQHGVIPVPVPATLNICRDHGLPLSPCEVEGELVTPTGAALVAALDPVFDLPARYRVRRIGLGAGKRLYARPSVLRAVLIDVCGGGDAARSAVWMEGPRDGEAAHPGAPHADELTAPAHMILLECDIDDATGEVLAYAAERLAAAGAREVHWVPVFGKKGRPGYQLQVLCLPEETPAMEAIVFSETTTLGIRRIAVERSVLPREQALVASSYGDITVKRAMLPDGSVRVKPEYEDCAALARLHGLPVRAVIQEALDAMGRETKRYNGGC